MRKTTCVTLLGGVLGGLAATSVTTAPAARPVAPAARPAAPAARPAAPVARPAAVRPATPGARPAARPLAPVGPLFVKAAGKTAGQPEGIGVALTDRGELLLKRGARPLVRVSLGVPPPPVPPAPVTLSSALVDVRQGGRDHQVLHVRAAGGEQRLEAVLWLRGPRATLIWVGATGDLGDFGAYHRELSVTPQGVAMHQRTRALMRCDGLAARMLSQGFHFASGRLLPILGQPPRAEGAVELIATTQAPPGARAEPLAPFRFESATSELGCNGDAQRVSPPSELHDGRPQTAWVEGSGGPGRFEYATAQAIGSPRPVVAVRLLPGHAGSPEKLRAHNRLKRFWLLLGPEHRYRVTVPSDPAHAPSGPAPGLPAGPGSGPGGPAGPGPAPAPGPGGPAGPGPAAAAIASVTPHWVILPRPVVSRCLTLMIDEVYPGPSGDTAVSELSVFTTLDFGSPLVAVLRGVTAGTLDREEAVRTLLGLAPTELPGLRAALSKAVSAAEQEVILRVLAQRDPLGSSAALIGGLRDADHGLRVVLLDAIVRAGDQAVPALAALLTGRPGPDLVKDVTRALGRIGTGTAAQALVARLGLGDGQQRRLLVDALTRFVLSTVQPVLWAQLGKDGGDALRGDLLRAIKGLSARHPGLRPAATALALSLTAKLQGFEARYRLVELMAQLGDPRLATPLAALLGGKEDPILREAAALALGRNQDPGRRSALARALADPSPRVRRGAVLAWALDVRGGAPTSGAALSAVLTLAQHEPWTFVREAAITALAEVCPREAHPLLLQLGARTASSRGQAAPKPRMRLRRLALLAGLRCRVPGLSALLGSILRDQDERTAMRALAVRLIAELRDRSQVPYLTEFLELLAKEVKRPRTRNEAFAADIALGLGRLGDRRALPALRFAAGVTRLPQLQAAALEALGSFCDPLSRPIIDRGRHSPDRVVVGTANRSAQRCGW